METFSDMRCLIHMWNDIRWKFLIEILVHETFTVGDVYTVAKMITIRKRIEWSNGKGAPSGNRSRTVGVVIELSDSPPLVTYPLIPEKQIKQTNKQTKIYTTDSN